MTHKLKLVILFAFSVILFPCQKASSQKPEVLEDSVIRNKPTLSFTFDDGITNDIAGFKFEEWNEMLLSHLDDKELKAIFFVTGRNKSDNKGQFLLQTWNDRGHKLANHTFNHPYYNSDKNDAEVFSNQLLKTDAIISQFSNHINLFRFPYLKEGHNPSKVDSLRNILSQNDYSNGYVTIDASDWYVNQRLIDKIKELGREKADIDKFKSFYVQHILERANYYEKLSFDLNKRHINHTLLLHHNLTSALFLDDLIAEFEKEGWEIIDAEKAYQDDIFKQIPNPEFAGESLIWSLAKQSGQYEEYLRYPAEDSRYEKGKMNKLGL